MVHRARTLCDCERLHDEMEFLRTTVRQNTYRVWQIQQAFSPPKIVTLAMEKPVSVTFLPFISTTFNYISRMLSRHNFKCVGLPPKEDSQ
jgi:hypothetical protein